MASKTFGIDFGSDSTKIYRKGQGVVYNQKTAIAYKGGKKILAIGDEAHEMIGKTPDTISVKCPIASALIAEIRSNLDAIYFITYLSGSAFCGLPRSGRIGMAMISPPKRIKRSGYLNRSL